MHTPNAAVFSAFRSSTERGRSPYGIGGLPFPLLLAASLVVLLFPVPGQDDFFITLWPALTLAEQGELVNYSGERVEQSSTLLLSSILAALLRITGLDPALGARLFSSICALACIPALAPALGLRGQRARLARWLLALFPPFLYWAASGTEMPVMALLLLIWARAIGHLRAAPSGALHRPSAFLALITAMVVANRPEAGLVCLAVCSWQLVVPSSARPGAKGTGWRSAQLWLPFVVVAIAFALLLLWRSFYFGAYWPLPVEAKVGSEWHAFPARWLAGLSYLAAWNGFGLLGLPLLAISVLTGLRIVIASARGDGSSTPEPGTEAMALIGLAYLGFTVASGGDWMEAGRFLVPAAPFLAALAAHGLLASPPAGRRWLVGTFLMLSAASILVLAAHPKNRALPLWKCGQSVDTDPAHGPSATAGKAWTERSNKTQIRDLAALDFLDSLIAHASSERLTPLTFASHQMGFVAYHLARHYPGSLRYVDAAGLVERTLVDCRAIRHRIERNAGGIWRQGHDYDPGLKVRFLLEDISDCARETADLDPDHPIDILYELGIPDPVLLAEYGLRPIYVQRGRFFGRPSLAFVAIREGLLGPLGLDGSIEVEYGSRSGKLTIERRRLPFSSAVDASPTTTETAGGRQPR